MAYVSSRDRDYSREYMRERRARLRAQGIDPDSYRKTPRERSQKIRLERNATYDPRRDPAPEYADLTARVLGDPPIGRRAIDRRV